MTRVQWPGVYILIGILAVFQAGCASSPHKSTAAVPTASSKVEAFSSPKLDNLNEQITRNPNNAQAYSNRGYLLALLGRKEQARADLKKTLELKNTAPMHNGAGWSYFNMGDYDDALREWKTAAEMSQNRAHYDYYSLALGYWGVGDMKGALENYQLAVEREPRFGEAKSLNERTIEWTPLERRAMREIYTLWSKTWRP